MIENGGRRQRPWLVFGKYSNILNMNVILLHAKNRGIEKTNMMDKKFGEWNCRVNSQRIPDPEHKVSLWKGPYHNTRACLEIIRDINGYRFVSELFERYIITYFIIKIQGYDFIKKVSLELVLCTTYGDKPFLQPGNR